jgi:molecular chaperone GrpE
VLEVEKGNLALLLIEVMDELELSLKASGDDQSPLARGVQLIRDGILKRIQALGIERVDVMDQAFDPNVAEAADTQLTTEPTEDQKVVAVVRPGYRLKDRIIRPARVRVARYLSPVQA